MHREQGELHKFSIPFIIVTICCLYAKDALARIIISEFMASNLSTFPDNHDYDDFSDWIELHNTASSDMDLTGYFLTDNCNNPTKWPIPSGTIIPARGFLIFRADGFDDRPGTSNLRDSYPWDTTFTTLYYHTNFKLAKEGEEIGLFYRSGSGIVLVDSIVFPPQFADVSMGRAVSGGTILYRFDQPTPGGPNITDAKRVERFSGEVAFSIPGGFYTGMQSVQLATETGDIYYTTDGSIPTKQSFKYSGPVVAIDRTTVMRARCIEADRLAGKVTTNTYFINEKPRQLMVVAIATDPSFLFDEEKGVWTNSLKKREWPTSFELFTVDGKQVVNVNGGMTLGSLSNFTLPQKPLQFKCNNKYGDDYIWYKLFAKNIACHERLRLRQGGDTWSGNYITDGMLESICTGQMELGTQAYRPVVVFVNGHYYGIEALREQFDDQFFINNYGIDPTFKDEVRTTMVQNTGNGAFGNIAESWELVSGTWNDYNALIALMKSGSMDNPKTYQRIKEMVDINSCIDFFCAIIYGCQITWTHNQDLWKGADGKWRWLIADFDRAFNDRYIGFNMFNRSIFRSGGIIPTDTLFTSLMTNTEFRNHFAQRFAAHLNSTFKPTRLKRIIDSLHTLILPEMEDHSNRWRSEGGIASVAEWEKELDDMKVFIDARSDSVYKHTADVIFNPFGTARLNIEFSGDDSGDIYINGVQMSQGLDSMRFFTTIPLEIKAIARPGFQFSGWKKRDSSTTAIITLTGDTTIYGSFIKTELYPIASLIDKNVILNKTDNPYTCTGDITISEGATLSLNKGVRLFMPQNGNILVKGRFIVNGTSDAKVIIRENNISGAKNWGALTFDTSADTCLLNWLEISGTTLGSDPLNQRAGINGNHSVVVINHLTMFNAIYPLYFEYGSTTIRHSTVTVDHICNGAIHIGRGDALVENCNWISTGVTINTDAIDIKGVHNGIIRDNRIYNFNGFNSDAIDLGESCKNILVSGNIIYGSYDKGISVGGNSTATISNNVIVGCDLGIGIKDDSTYALIDHNTFARNRIGVAVYSKVYGRGGGSANVTNCIFSASKSSSFFSDRFSSITFSHCLSDIDILTGSDNLLDDPSFIDARANNFQLQKTSPCFDKADHSSPPDSNGTATDIGAQYSYSKNDFPDSLVPSPTPPKVVINEIMYNDGVHINSDDWIELYNPSSATIDIGGWKLTDKGDYTSWETSAAISDIDSTDIFIIPDGTKLQGGGFLVIAEDVNALKEAGPGSSNFTGALPFNLRPGETLLLYNENDSLVNAIVCRNSEPWPTSPDGTGPSLELIDANELNYHPRNWTASLNTGGTPGTPNTLSPPSALHAPLSYRLAQNYPNPCNELTNIRFDIPDESRVTIDLFDLSGRHLNTVFNKRLFAGYHSVTANMRNYSAGIYLYRIKAGTFIETKKITIQ